MKKYIFLLCKFVYSVYYTSFLALLVLIRGNYHPSTNPLTAVWILSSSRDMRLKNAEILLYYVTSQICGVLRWLTLS